MNRYPSAASVPPAIWDRAMLTVWIILSALVIVPNAWQAIQHPHVAPTILRFIGVGLLYTSVFGIAGLMLRHRRLRRARERQAFLDHLAETSIGDE